MVMLPSTSNSNASQSATDRPLLPLPADAPATVNNYQFHGPVNQPGNANLLDNPYLGGEMDDSLGFNLLDMSTEMYETFSQIEPISVTMNPGFDIF